jgi:thiamine biosynthesis lipoprotein
MSRLVAIAVLGATSLGVLPLEAAETAAGRTMGTSWSVIWHGAPVGADELPPAVVQDELRRLLERIESLMSTWRDDSEVSRFNASRSTDWFEVSPETFRVVRRSLEVSASSGGAFDVTVSRLVDLWGFGHKGKQPPPTDSEIETARQLAGWSKLEVRADPPAIRKTEPLVTVNLSAIAKGYAVDRLGEFLESVGVAGYLVEVGGETRLKGSRSDGADWRLGIEQPVAGRRLLRCVLPLSGPSRGVATSGDYRNRRQVGDRIVSHTIDPRTGRPVEHDLAAVTVVAADCMTADALATTLMVLGPEDGVDYARQHHIAALFLVRVGDGIREESTVEYRALASEPGGPSAAVDWWSTWLPVLALVLLAVLGLSVGVLFKGKMLMGSCGGLALLCSDRDDPECGACRVRGAGADREMTGHADHTARPEHPEHPGHADQESGPESVVEGQRGSG